MITSISLIQRKIRKEKRLQINYTSKDGNWEGFGTFANVYIIDGFLVVVNIAGLEPMMVCDSIENLTKRLREKTGCELIIDSPLSFSILSKMKR